MRWFHFCIALLSLSFLFPASGEDSFPALDKADSLAKVSEFLSDDCLQNKGREFVTVKRLSFSLRGPAETETYGWRDDKGVTHFPDGSHSKGKATLVDFDRFCDEIINPDAKRAEERADTFYHMGLTADPSQNQITPALCALWLHRQGKKEAAAKMWKLVAKDLERGREEDSEAAFLGVTGSYSPWYLFNRAVSAHMYDEGVIALEAIARLAKVHPKAMDQFGAGDRLLADLMRRKSEKRLSVKSEFSPPKDFAKLEAKEKVAYLIKNLDQVNARQWGQPGGVSFTDDWRVRELIGLGDTAVTPLIDCLEKDDRLTKSVHYWRDFSQSRTVLSVREAALSALMSILQVQLFEAGFTGDNFTSRENKGLQKMVKSLRDYWKKNEGIDRDQRMMNVITDKTKPKEERLRAIESLAWYDHTFGMSTMVFSDVAQKNKDFKKHPLIDRFSDPSLAEVIWQIALEGEDDHDRRFCLAALAKIKDSRIAGAIKATFGDQKTLAQKLLVADVVSELGDDELMVGLAAGLNAGSLAYSKADLGVIINRFSSKRLEACDRFLMSLADRKHPHYRETLYGLLEDENGYIGDDDGDPFGSESSGGEDPDWPSHPFVIEILRRALEDKTRTEAYKQVEGDGVISFGTMGGGFGSSFGNEWLKEHEVTKERVSLRICDLAAGRLAYFVEGLPFYSALLIERDLAFAEFVLASRKELHELPTKYADYLGGEGARFFYLTLPEVMTRLATGKDVTSGLAAFALKEGGEMITQKLPAFGKTIPEIPGYPEVRKVIVLQAERSKSGEEFYGCLTHYGLEKLSAKEVALAK